MLVVSCFYELKYFFESQLSTRNDPQLERPTTTVQTPPPVQTRTTMNRQRLCPVITLMRILTPAGCKRNIPDLFMKAQTAFAIVWVPSSSYVSLFNFLSFTNYMLLRI